MGRSNTSKELPQRAGREAATGLAKTPLPSSSLFIGGPWATLSSAARDSLALVSSTTFCPSQSFLLPSSSRSSPAASSGSLPPLLFQSLWCVLFPSTLNLIPPPLNKIYEVAVGSWVLGSVSSLPTEAITQCLPDRSRNTYSQKY